MPLITASEVIEIAFASNIDPLLIKESNIKYAEERYIPAIITKDLYNLVIASPGSYTTLINNYIKPCLAYFVKYVSMNQLLIETANFNDLRDIDTLPELIPSFRSYRISKHLREGILNEVLSTANFLSRQLFDYADANHGPLKPAPTDTDPGQESKTLSPAGFFIFPRS